MPCLCLLRQELQGAPQDPTKHPKVFSSRKLQPASPCFSRGPRTRWAQFLPRRPVHRFKAHVRLFGRSALPGGPNHDSTSLAPGILGQVHPAHLTASHQPRGLQEAQRERGSRRGRPQCQDWLTRTVTGGLSCLHAMESGHSQVLASVNSRIGFRNLRSKCHDVRCWVPRTHPNPGVIKSLQRNLALQSKVKFSLMHSQSD